jgi:monofunctional biosynthetic peptidoglycan transglycosylase
MRTILRWTFRVVLGIIIGLILYEGVLFVRVLWLRSHNPSSTSLIDTRASEAQDKGQEARREQTWVPLDRVSVNLQRAVLAGEDTNFVTHHGFDYQAIQKRLSKRNEKQRRKQRRKAKMMTGCRVCLNSNEAVQRSRSS